MTKAAIIIFGAIAFYKIVWHVATYFGKRYLYKKEKKNLKNGPPRAYYPSLRKPTFFNN